MILSNLSITVSSGTSGVNETAGGVFDNTTYIRVADYNDMRRGSLKARRIYAQAIERINTKHNCKLAATYLCGSSVLDTDLTLLKTNRWMEQMYVQKMPLAGRKCYQVYQDRDSPCHWYPTLLTIETGARPWFFCGLSEKDGLGKLSILVDERHTPRDPPYATASSSSL